MIIKNLKKYFTFEVQVSSKIRMKQKLAGDKIFVIGIRR
jgi:hypothetical protein